MDAVQNLDPHKLILGLTALSFVLSPFSSPPYNLPISLFGVIVQSLENTDGQALQIFCALLGGSVVFDLVWVFSAQQSWFIRLLTILLLLLKIPTFFTFGAALRQRGGQFTGLNIRGGDLGGATVWDSMPGGFGGGGHSGYQNLDDPVPSMPVAQPAPQQPQPPAPAAAAQPYQTV
ncbi:hypothetical protein MKEN_00818200 [Mycena kentingensis (nom. inval.)]|nr:hypothetical protein MKEN_00818200 [Mycena kentingensis (nom. inval.)]